MLKNVLKNTTSLFIELMFIYRMLKTTTLCANCLEIITNPMCANCFIEHILYWLRDQRLPQKTLDKILIDFELPNLDGGLSNNDTCVVCGSEQVYLCTVCFVEKAKKILNKNIRDKKILASFQEDFNPVIWKVFQIK